jgi:hypothetical protein
VPGAVDDPNLTWHTGLPQRANGKAPVKAERQPRQSWRSGSSQAYAPGSSDTVVALPSSKKTNKDLAPEFERRKLNAIYVDLWIDKAVNPAIHIANAIRTELAREDGAIAKTLKKLTNMSKLTVGA